MTKYNKFILLILITVLFINNSGCEENLNPCIKGVLVQRHTNCFLIIQVLNAPLGETYHYYSSPGYSEATEYKNCVATNLDINASKGDTIYFIHEKKDIESLMMECLDPRYLANPNLTSPEIPGIEISSYSLHSCP